MVVRGKGVGSHEVVVRGKGVGSHGVRVLVVMR